MFFDQYGNARVLLYDASGNPLLVDNNALRVSLYGKGAAVGDTPVDVDGDGHLQVDVLAGGGVSMVDDAAFVVGTSSVAPMGAMADEAAVDSVDEGDVGIPRMTLNRILRAALVGKNAAAGDTDVKVDASGYVGVNVQNVQYVKLKSSNDLNLYCSFPDTDALNHGTGYGLQVLGTNYLFDGSDSWNRQRGNVGQTVLSSAARTGDTNSGTMTNYNHRGVLLALDVTAVGGPAGQIDVINIQVAVGGTWKTIYSFSALAINSVSQSAFLIYPGAASAGAFTAAPLQGTLPRSWRVSVDHANEADSITYSIVANYIL